MRAYWLEGAKWLDQVLKATWDQNDRAEKAARAQALYCRADLAHQLDEEVSPYAESALTLCQEVEDRWGVAYSRAAFAFSLWRKGSPKGSRPLLEQSLREFQDMGDVWGEATVSLWLAGAFILLGLHDEYFGSRLRALDCARRSGDRELIARLLRRIAADHISEGNWDEAEQLLEETGQLFKAMGFSPGVNEMYLLRARTHLGRGKNHQAKMEAERCLEHCLRAGEYNLQAKLMLLLGVIAELEKNLPTAEEYIQRGIELIREQGQPEYIWWNIALARLHYLQGQYEHAKQSVSASLQTMKSRNMEVTEAAYVFHHLAGFFIKEKTQISVQYLALSSVLGQRLVFVRDPTYDQPYAELFLSEARTKLDEEEFITSWHAGLRMTTKEALDLALRVVEEM